MSFLRGVFQPRLPVSLAKLATLYIPSTTTKLNLSSGANFRPCVRWLSLTPHRQQEELSAEAEANEDDDSKEETVEQRPVVDVQTSINYMNSKAYEITYGASLVWEPYRRNHKGRRPPQMTRKTCIRKGVISTGNPCPICRDEYLVLDPENTALLKQFISSHTGDIISYEKTGLCQKQHKNLLKVVNQAWDIGNLEMPLPFRKYDYTHYYPQLKKQ